MMLGNSKNGERNRSILLDHLDGHSVDALAVRHKLCPTSIRGIISFERDRVCVSTEREYCQLRKSIDPAIWAIRFERPFDAL